MSFSLLIDVANFLGSINNRSSFSGAMTSPEKTEPLAKRDFVII